MMQNCLIHLPVHTILEKHQTQLRVLYSRQSETEALQPMHTTACKRGGHCHKNTKQTNDPCESIATPAWSNHATASHATIISIPCRSAKRRPMQYAHVLKRHKGISLEPVTSTASMCWTVIWQNLIHEICMCFLVQVFAKFFEPTKHCQLAE